MCSYKRSNLFSFMNIYLIRETKEFVSVSVRGKFFRVGFPPLKVHELSLNLLFWSRGKALEKKAYEIFLIFDFFLTFWLIFLIFLIFFLIFSTKCTWFSLPLGFVFVFVINLKQGRALTSKSSDVFIFGHYNCFSKWNWACRPICWFGLMSRYCN